MTDIVVLGGASLWQSDALQGFGIGAEAGVKLKIETKGYAILDEHGEAAIRRVRLTGYVEDRVTFRVVPVVDGRRRNEAVQVVQVEARVGGVRERFTKLVTPSRINAYGSRSLLRGSEFALEIEVVDPRGGWFLDSGSMEFEPVGLRRRREPTGYEYIPPPAGQPIAVFEPESLRTKATPRVTATELTNSSGYRVVVAEGGGAGFFNIFLYRDDGQDAVDATIAITGQDEGGASFTPPVQDGDVEPADLGTQAAITSTGTSNSTGFQVLVEEPADGRFLVRVIRDDGEESVDAVVTITGQDEGGATLTEALVTVDVVPIDDTSFSVVATRLDGQSDLNTDFRITQQDRGGASLEGGAGGIGTTLLPSGAVLLFSADMSGSINQWDYVNPNMTLPNPKEAAYVDGELVFPFPDGHLGGTLQGRVGLESSSYATGPEATHLAFKMRHSLGWQGHQSGINKVVFFGFRGENGTSLYFEANGSDQNPMYATIVCRGTYANTLYGGDTKLTKDGCVGGSAANWTANGIVNSANPTDAEAEIVRGQDHVIELLFEHGTPGNSDGRIAVANNGVVVLDYRDFPVTRPGETPGMRYLNFSPVWGGTGDVVAQDQTLYIDDVGWSSK